MERNCGSMKVLFAGVIGLLCLCQFTFAQQGRATTLSPNLFGSAPPKTAPTGNTIPLSVSDTIDRALKYNLGTIISEQETRVSRAERVRALSELLPKVSMSVGESVQQINLAVFGFSGFPGVAPIVGPFSVLDVRARYVHTVMDFRYLHELRSAAEKVNAGNYAQQDVRELVVLITTNLYLETIAASSRVDAARAQLRTAQAVYDRAVNLKDSGVIPGIDVLRAQVQLQNQQQRVVGAENDLAKQKLNLARAIGLPQGQAFTQTDSFVTASTPVLAVEEALAIALEARPDYRRSLALIRAAEETRKAANGRRLPSLLVSGDYGDIGRTLGFSHATFGFQGTLLIPIYTGERARAEIIESDSVIEQRKAESANLRERIEYDIRSSSLDIQSAAEQVRVAQGARDLAQQQLVQAQDRFAAGVTNGLEVTQAQDAVAVADENYISSLYTLNVAQASLARAVGAAEKTIKSFFGGK
jgi:outer membrane protein TolC